MKIFIGYDKEEKTSFHMAVQSIIENSSKPIEIVPLVKDQIEVYQRKRTKHESSDFSLTRFLVPFLSDYKGWSLYCDCDFIFKEDITKLFDLSDDQFSIMVCKHNYQPSRSQKKIFFHQERYEFKNWSSLILFNNSKCGNLTPEYIHHAKGLDLHQFTWLNHQDIGSIPLNWNHLVDENNQIEPVYGYHFTNGTPLTDQCSSPYNKIWYNAFKESGISSSTIFQKEEKIPRFTESRQIKPFEHNNMLFTQIPPMFKNSKQDAVDYIQLIEENTGEIFHLKSIDCFYKNIKAAYPSILSQFLGSFIANSLGFDTQSCELIEVEKSLWLLTKDIRGTKSIVQMDPIYYLTDKKIEATESDFFKISDCYESLLGRNIDQFLLEVYLLDFLMANTSRDARSFRVIFDNNQREIINLDGKIHDFLIENNFGSHYFIPIKGANKLDIDLLYSIIKKLSFEYQAIKFINKISITPIEREIKENVFFPKEFKSSALSILQEQYSQLLTLKKSIVS